MPRDHFFFGSKPIIELESEENLSDDGQGFPMDVSLVCMGRETRKIMRMASHAHSGHFIVDHSI
jgi:hypothetical protein